MFRRALLSSSSALLTVTPAVCLQKIFFRNSNWNALCDSDVNSDDGAKKVPEIIIVDDLELDKAWEIEKENCSFCYQFLRSPCKDSFRRWSKCVDKAKELDTDFIQACTIYTKLLMDCTSDNSAFFEKWKEEHEKEDEVDDAGEIDGQQAIDKVKTS